MTLQQNQREIVPIQIWSDGTFYNVNVLTLTNYMGYDFISSAGQVQYSLVQWEQGVDGSIYESVIAQGNVPLTYALVAVWGADDQPIFDFVAQHLQLTLV